VLGVVDLCSLHKGSARKTIVACYGLVLYSSGDTYTAEKRCKGHRCYGLARPAYVMMLTCCSNIRSGMSTHR
jgi:hypothetical protein